MNAESTHIFYYFIKNAYVKYLLPCPMEGEGNGTKDKQ